MTALSTLVRTYPPEPSCGCVTWKEHTLHLVADDEEYMNEMIVWMREVGRWPDGPVVVDDGFVQDGHHRIVVALLLKWLDHEVPVEARR